MAKSSPFEDFVELTQGQVDSMFKAATKDQMPVLESIFGKQEDLNPLTEEWGRKFEKEMYIKGVIDAGIHLASDIRRDLMYRSLYVTEYYKVILHNTPGGGTIIELKKKKA